MQTSPETRPMKRCFTFQVLASAACCVILALPQAHAQANSHATGSHATGHSPATDVELFSQMQWRAIGPLRGGRMRALSGVASQPNVFYAGADDGGVWKSTDYGESWRPIFDDQPTGSIGAIAVAASNPDVIYVGSGEGIIRPDGTIGDGMYKSTDAGKTWTHLGLRDTQKISQVIVDPRDPDHLFVAAMGHPYGPNEERGIFRSTDGGRTFEKVLYKDAYTSGEDVDFDPTDPDIVYASLWQQQQAPWENGSFGGNGGGLFKSTDGGTTWKPLTRGLPDGVQQIAMSVAPSDARRLYASVATADTVGIYRSDDAGASWTRATTDQRPAARIGGGDLPTVAVDPENPDIVYSCTPVLWRSVDAGTTWTGFRGAPGGDDYQQLWINPDNPALMFVTVDQGVIVTVNGGASWSSWYNQPTAAMYKVAADNAWPYRVCGGQQDSGSACVASRSDDGQLTTHDWHPAGIEEYGAAAPDPLDSDIVYGGKVTRYDRRTGQIQEVGPKAERGGDYRVLRTMPLQFSPIDPHTLYFASNVVWKTRDGGTHWTAISKDLTRHGQWTVPPNIGKYRGSKEAKPTDRAVVYALAPSPLDVDLIWAGTDDGLIWLTRDGGAHWNNVTPPQMKPWWKVFAMDASHSDPGTVYVAVNTLRLDDMNPHLLRTRDGGKSWIEIDNGIAPGAVTNVIREDPKKKGLLFAGSETQTWVSFDDGDDWQSLRLNMPAISVRDLAIKDDDLIAATHGRGYWILDDITPLRQIDDAIRQAGVTLYAPQVATRVRWGTNPPTPWRMTHLDNPPPGAIIDYHLAADARGPVTLDILDADGAMVRHYSSAEPDTAFDPAKLDVPVWWPRPPQNLSVEAGHHRFVWDLRYAPIPGLTPRLDYDQAVINKTPKTATSPWVMPGSYRVRLTVEGHAVTQPLTVRMDPRVKTSVADLGRQFDLARQAYDQTLAGLKALGQIRDLQKQLQQRSGKSGKPAASAAYAKELDAIAGKEPADPFFYYGYKGPPNLASVAWSLRQLMGAVEAADRAPTEAQADALAKAGTAMQGLLAQWKTLEGKPLAQLNRRLRGADLQPLAVTAEAPVPERWDRPWVRSYKADM
jgi:photosystem II stability/assembly factor-like uncharacterized protein